MRRRSRIGAPEVMALAVLSAVAAWVAARATAPPVTYWQHPDERRLAAEFADRFGPGRASERMEEWIIRDFFGDRRQGVYADIGAGDWKDGSNTLYLERQLGWSGLAVDALDTVADGWRRNRPRTRFATAFVDDTDGQPRVLHVTPDHPNVSSGDRAFTAMFAQPTSRVTVQSATLNRLLEQAGISRLDFLSMDIETGEPAALRGFDVRKYTPALVCIEAFAPVRQQILDYFTTNGYVVVSRYLRLDEHNLYFRPLSNADPAAGAPVPGPAAR